MILLRIVSKRGQLVSLTSERWNHIIFRHPEMDGYLEELKEVCQNPDFIVQNELDPGIIFFHKYYKEEKRYIVLVVEEGKEFIITAYTANTIKRGCILWQKK